MLAHPSRDVSQFRDFPVDLLVMVVVVREGVVDLGRGQVRELAQDLLDGKSAAVILHDRADRKPGTSDYWSPALHARSAFHVRMCNSDGFSRSTHFRFPFHWDDRTVAEEGQACDDLNRVLICPDGMPYIAGTGGCHE